MTAPLLLVRADAGPRIGAGHVMRCLALAQAWNDAGGEVRFAMAEGADAVNTRLTQEGVDVTDVTAAPGASGDAEATVRLARASSARAVVLDGYTFGLAHQQALRDAGMRTLVVDDDAATGRYVADLVLDPNAFASEERYRARAEHTRLLLGPTYALLRREFVAHGPRAERADARPQRLLVSFGGADPYDLSTRALSALPRMDVEAVVLIGAANPRREALEEGARSVTGARVLYDAPNVPELMAWADVALVAAGGTCLELAYMGLPSLAVVTAENQRRVAECLAELGTVRSLGEAATVTSPRIADEVCHLLANREERRTMAARGRALVDGLGARRVIDVLWEVSS